MMQGAAVRDYVVLHEVFGAGVERLQLGAPVVHRLRLPLSPGFWLMQITITAGVSNVSFTARLADDIPGAKALGGAHNGAMSPHFSPATMTAFIDDAVVTSDRPLELVVTFEAVGPNTIAVLGHRSISVMAWKKAEPAVVAKPKAERAVKAEKPAAKEVAAPPLVADVAAAPPVKAAPPALKAAAKPAAPAKAPAKPAPAAPPAAAKAEAAAEPARETAPKPAAPGAAKARPAAKAAPVKAAKPAPAKTAAAKRK